MKLYPYVCALFSIYYRSRASLLLPLLLSLFACGAGEQTPQESPTPQASQSPSQPSASPEPVATPTSIATSIATPLATPTPIILPSARPSAQPSLRPTQVPTMQPTQAPTQVPSPQPTLPPEQVFQPVSLLSETTKVQPMTGIVLWADSHNNSGLKQSDEFIQLEYAYVKPSDIVQQQGVYDWSTLESLLDAVSARGHQAILRWYYVYPGSETAVPEFIKDLEDYKETTGRTEGQSTDFPDWSHTVLQQFHLDFYSKFAQRYDSDPRIAFLQLGFGLWGEYHIYDGPNAIGEQFPSKPFQRQFIDHLSASFQHLHWSISIDAGDDYYSPFDEDNDLRGVRFGLFDDSFMHKTHADYNQDMWNVFAHAQRFRQSPHGGELSYYSQFDQKNVLNKAGMHGRTYESLSAQYHISYMIGNDQPSYQSHQRIKQAGMANGYKFRITEFMSSADESRIRVENIGIAPIYYPAFVAVNGVRAGQSLHELMPGQSQIYTVAAGGSEPMLSIESDRLVSGQRIQFDADL